MAQAAVLEALGNDLILERIFQPYDFKRLKELRMVCKSWNAFACRQLRSRCKNIRLCTLEQLKSYSECFPSSHIPSPCFEKPKEVQLLCNHWNWIFFGKLCDCNGSKVRSNVQQQQTQLASPEMFLKIPVDVEIYFTYIDFWGMKSFPMRLARSDWRSQVVSLTINIWLTVAQVNGLTLFLLDNLPGLKKLDYCYMENQSSTAHQNDDSQVPDVDMACDTKFGLEYLHFRILEGGFQAQVLDPGFLRHCFQLKTLEIIYWAHSNPKMGNNICLNFFNRWNQMALAEPDAFPRIRHLKFEFWSQFRPKVGNYVEFVNSIIDLINLNEPTQLDFFGNFDYNFPNMFSKISCWTPGIQALSIDVPTCKRGNSSFDDFFRFLKKYSVFAQLTQVSLRPSPSIVQDKLQLAGSGDEHHQLPKVIAVSLEFQIQNQLIQSLHRLVAMKFSNLTNLNLKLPEAQDYDWSAGFDEVFEFCKNFPVLRRLSLEKIDTLERRFPFSKRPYDPTFQGHLKRLQDIKSLENFKFIVGIENAEMQCVLVTLFQGYEPHVCLDLEVRTVVYRFSLGRFKAVFESKKLVLSVEGFKEALQKACRQKSDED